MKNTTNPNSPSKNRNLDFEGLFSSISTGLSTNSILLLSMMKFMRSQK